MPETFKVILCEEKKQAETADLWDSLLIDQVLPDARYSELWASPALSLALSL